MLCVYVSPCCQHWLHFVGTVAILHMVVKHTSAGPTQNNGRDLIVLSKETWRQTRNSNDGITVNVGGTTDFQT